MNRGAYVDELSKRYQRYFNVHRDYELLGDKLDIFAEYKVKNESYFLTKSAVLFAFDNFEYCLVKSYTGQADLGQLEQFTQYIVKATDEIVKPSTEHMSSYVSGIMISEKGFTQEALHKAQKFKYSKNFLFTIKGWCDVRLVLVDLESNEITTNKKGKEVIKNYIVPDEQHDN